jgi:uncharacterized protein
MARGQAEATEYALNNGYNSVRLLSVEEGTSYRGTDVIVTGSRISNMSAPPPPPPPPAAPERDGGILAPGQLETAVSLNLLSGWNAKRVGSQAHLSRQRLQWAGSCHRRR